MKTLTKTLLAAASLAGLFCAAPALADDAPAWSLSGGLAVTSDYRFRGISQNQRTVAPQGTLNLTGPDGFYVGTWLSQVDWDPAANSSNPNFEMDIYGGKHFDLDGYADLNVEAYYYSYPDQKYPGLATANFFEGIFQLSHSYDALSLTATWAYSPNFTFNGGTGNFIGGTAAYAVNDWLSVSGNLGHQWVQAAKYAGSSDYTYGDIGGTLTYKNFSLDGRYVATDLSAAKCAAFYMGTTKACAGGFVATLSYTITLWP
jgi:uncharacterized protein (TIGR02001 family)